MYPFLSRQTHKATLKRNIAMLLGAVLCMIWALVGYGVNKTYNDRFETFVVVSQNLVRSLTAHTETSFELIRHLLKDAAYRVDALGPKPPMSADVTQVLGASIENHKPLNALVAIDAEGTIVQAAISVEQGGYTKIAPFSVTDREYFQHFAHAQTPNPNELFVGRPIEARGLKIWFIPVASPRINPDGSFGGVMLGAIRLDTFGDLFKTFDLPSNSSVALVRSDGIFLARTPYNKVFFERSYADNPFFTDALPKATQGVFHDRSSIDQNNRVLTYQSLSTLPLVFVLTRTYGSIIEGWLADSMVALIVGGISTLILLVFAWILWRQADSVERHRFNLEQEVAEQTRELLMSKEDAVNANTAKSELLSIVSHELRTPLTSIKGSLELLSKHFLLDLMGDPKKLLDTATKNTERLVLLVNDILDMEKIISGKVALQMEDINLRDLVEHEIEHIEGYVSGLGVQVEMISKDADVIVRGDKFKLGQVLNNLLSNAAKCSNTGDTVFVAISRHDDVARVSVVDLGCGIAEEFQDKIFEKFSQIGAQERGLYKGTGLGLSIAQAIIEQHQGTIGFQSKEGAGSTFYFDLAVLDTFGDGA